MEKCGIYLGCNIPFRAPDIEQSLNKVFPQLGVKLVSMEGATRCPAWGTAPLPYRDHSCYASFPAFGSVVF